MGSARAWSMNWSGIERPEKKKKKVAGDRISSLLFLKYSSGFPAVINSADGEVALEVNEKKWALHSIDWNIAEATTQPLEISGALWLLLSSVWIPGSPAAPLLQPSGHPSIYWWWVWGGSITTPCPAAESLNQCHLERQAQYPRSLVTHLPLEFWWFWGQEWFSK